MPKNMKNVFLGSLISFMFFISGPAHAKPWCTELGSGTDRYIKVFNDQAALDKETGLTWTVHGFATTTTATTLENAQQRCVSLAIGDRKGWRLPTVYEFLSLFDMSSTDAVKLPAGHPFTDIQFANYWTSTTLPVTTSLSYGINPTTAVASTFGANQQLFVWCVRGGAEN